MSQVVARIRPLTLQPTQQAASPRVLLIGLSEPPSKQLRSELASQGIEVSEASTPSEAWAQLADPDVYAAVLCGNSTPQPVEFITRAHAYPHVGWYLYSENQTVSFRCRALLEAKALEVLPYPVVPTALTRRLVSLAGKAFSPNLSILTSAPAEPKAAKPAPLLKPAWPGLDELTAVTATPQSMTGRGWPLLSAADLGVVRASYPESLRAVERMLKALHAHTDAEGRMSLITFGVRSPIVDPHDSPEFIVMSSTARLPEPHPLATALYPELAAVLKAQTPLLSEDVFSSRLFHLQKDLLKKARTRSVASIPLFRANGRMLGALKIRFPTRASGDTKTFLADLSAYARHMAPLADSLDYFGRIYAGSGLESVRAWKI